MHHYLIFQTYVPQSFEVALICSCSKHSQTCRCSSTLVHLLRLVTHCENYEYSYLMFGIYSSLHLASFLALIQMFEF
jgi:hypothetical protein